MRHLSRSLAVVAVAAMVAVGLYAGPAHAAAPPSSAGQRFALRAANGLYVAAEIEDLGSHDGMLRARSDSAGSWETFTLHTYPSPYGEYTILRSEAAGLYVTAEMNDSGADYAMLRARGTGVGSWEQFVLKDEGSGYYSLRSKYNGRYVTAELGYTGSSAGMLRARGTAVGSWERFKLEALPGAPVNPPGAAAASAQTVRAVSWNVCANSSLCPLWQDGQAAVADAVADAATNGGFSPDVLFLQEFCEKDAKPVELELEARTGRGWDVRFAPIQFRALNTSVLVQKLCVPTSGVDRGSYGIAVAVPDANTWYRATVLTSPPAYEQRTVLCAVIESRALNFCGTHLSSPGSGDDPTGSYRAQQVTELLNTVAKPGYRSVFGGDLNITPPDASGGSTLLAPVYAAYEECDQSAHGGSRTGTATAGSSKIDYIFGPQPAAYQCRVNSGNTLSDHKPIYATISIPA